MKSSYQLRAGRKFRSAVWIEGDGPFALVAECRHLTVKLYPTEDRARAVMRSINSTGCGGQCWRGDAHYIYNLDTRKRLTSDDHIDNENQHL